MGDLVSLRELVLSGADVWLDGPHIPVPGHGCLVGLGSRFFDVCLNHGRCVGCGRGDGSGGFRGEGQFLSRGTGGGIGPGSGFDDVSSQEETRDVFGWRMP